MSNVLKDLCGIGGRAVVVWRAKHGYVRRWMSLASQAILHDSRYHSSGPLALILFCNKAEIRVPIHIKGHTLSGLPQESDAYPPSRDQSAEGRMSSET